MKYPIFFALRRYDTLCHNVYKKGHQHRNLKVQNVGVASLLRSASLDDVGGGTFYFLKLFTFYKRKYITEDEVSKSEVTE